MLFKKCVNIFYLIITFEIKDNKKFKFYFYFLVKTFLKIYYKLNISIKDYRKKILFFSLNLFDKNLYNYIYF